MTDNANRRVLLQAAGITKVFGSGAGEVKPLKGIDLKLYAGELTLLMGPSGSGKTTLLSILGCILSPTDGSLEVAGNSTHGQDAEGLANIRRRHVGFVFQGYNLFPTMTARENVMLALDVRARPVVDPASACAQRAEGRRTGTSRQCLSGQAVGRREAARCAGACARRGAVGDPRRRADRGARRGERPRGDGASLRGGEDPNRAVLAVTHDHRTMPYADRIVRIEDGKIHSDERPKKDANPTYGAAHDEHDSHTPPAGPAAAVQPVDDNPTTPPKSLGRRFRIRRHA